MRILIDIGNTKTKYLINDESFSFDTSEILSGNIPSNLLDIQNGEFYISSVNPKARDILLDNLDYSSKVSIVSPIESKSLVLIDDDMKKELGSDIFLALNASILNSKSFINVDFGTALTFNLVIDSKYIGCAIAPGVYTSYNALIYKAALLNKVELKEDIDVLGLNTEEALSSGLINGYASLFDEYINRIMDRYNLDDIDIYVTGGAYKLVKPYIKHKVIEDNNLVLNGFKAILGK